MSRLGSWRPTTDAARLDRLESLASIRQLAMRYALMVDSRNMDGLVELFVPDVRVGGDKQGREALKEWYTEALRHPRVSVHSVSNHVVDFDDADRARGVVYCRDELEQPARGTWEAGQLQYWDTYVRQDGEWYFQRRKFHRWYIDDVLTRPSHGAGVGTDGTLRTHLLPDAFETWASFWDRVSAP